MSDFEDKVKAQFDPPWGKFRKYLKAHPLRGMWIGFVAGAFAGGLVVYKVLPAVL